MRMKYLIKSFNSKYETTSIEPLKSLKYGSVRKILAEFGDPLTQFGNPKKDRDP